MSVGYSTTDYRLVLEWGMKILVISDSHGHIANLKTVMEIAKKSHLEAVIHAGDWDNIESVETVLNFGIPLYTVTGNADVEEGLEDYLRLNAKKFEPKFLRFNLGGRKIGIVHRVKKDDVFENLDIVFSGHYHSNESKMVNFLKFVRPGAILNGINFAVYETETNDVNIIEDTSS
jgi:putative phosphoesterase